MPETRWQKIAARQNRAQIQAWSFFLLGSAEASQLILDSEEVAQEGISIGCRSSRGNEICCLDFLHGQKILSNTSEGLGKWFG